MTAGKSKTPNVLVILGVLFTLGGVARLLPGAAASAEGAETDSASPAVTETAASTAYADNTANTGAPSASNTLPSYNDDSKVCFTDETARQLKEEQDLLRTERDTLQDARLNLAAREAELQAKLAELDALNAKLDQRWQDMQATSRQDLQHLASMYGAMKADQAAQIFDQMDSAFAARFLRMISSEQAGLILAAMDTDKAYVVSVEIANFNADIRGN